MIMQTVKLKVTTNVLNQVRNMQNKGQMQIVVRGATGELRGIIECRKCC